MKNSLLFILWFAFIGGVMAQMPTVQLNSKKRQFDDGRILPSEKAFIVSADADPTISLVKMQLFDGGFNDAPLSECSWKRKAEDASSVAILANHYKLRNGRDYSFKFSYYRAIQDGERTQLRAMLGKTTKSLLESNILLTDDRYKFVNSPNDLFNDLNRILTEGLIQFEHKTADVKPVFSQIAANMLRGLTQFRATKNAAGIPDNQPKLLLIKQLENEIEMISNNCYYVLEDKVEILDYPTEKKSNGIALNVGYGGVYRSGSSSSFDYVTGPYAGITLPLASRSLTGGFWNKTSLSVGVFINDFVGQDSVKLSGPLLKRPIYGAIGYRFFDFMRLHVGTALLEEAKTDGSKSIYFKPFVGLSIEFNMLLSLAKNR
jgi:hypothetical protein